MERKVQTKRKEGVMAVAAAGAFMASNATAIMTATAVGSSLMQGIEARNQAKAAREQQKRQNESAIESMQHQYGVLNDNERESLRTHLEESMDIQEIGRASCRERCKA